MSPVRHARALNSSSCVLIFPTTYRNRRRSSDVAHHWLPGWPGQPVTWVYVFRQAEERCGLSYQNPAQHLPSSVSPNAGSTVDLLCLCACDHWGIKNNFWSLTNAKVASSVACVTMHCITCMSDNCRIFRTIRHTENPFLIFSKISSAHFNPMHLMY